MSERLRASTDRTLAPDVCLLLRAHAEQLWLSREVIPVLRQIEARDSELPDEQLGAAYAYLEVVWIDALEHARESEAALELLDQTPTSDERAALCAAAERYYGSVKDLRRAVESRVQHRCAAVPLLED